MAEPITRPTKTPFSAYLKTIKDPVQRADSQTIARLMQQATGEPPVLWGPAIVGFGEQTIKYASGKELEWPVAAFSPRKGNLTLYIMNGFKREAALRARLGKHTTGKICLYIKKLADVDLKVLEEMIEASISHEEKRAR